MFKAMDLSGDKSLSLDELTRGLKGLGLSLSEGQVLAFQRQLDTNVDGGVSLVEFTSAVQAEREALSAALGSAWSAVRAVSKRQGRDLERLFRETDTDGSGGLELLELAELMARCGAKLSPREQRVLMQSIDEDGDGSVNYAEFMGALQRSEALPSDAAAADEAWEQVGKCCLHCFIAAFY